MSLLGRNNLSLVLLNIGMREREKNVKREFVYYSKYNFNDMY